MRSGGCPRGMERLLVALGILCLASGCAGIHSMKFFLSVVNLPGPKQPAFICIIKLDDIIIATYNSVTQALETPYQWVTEEAGEEWKGFLLRIQLLNTCTRGFLNVVMESMNQTTGLHTLQAILGCESNDEQTAYLKFAFDGETLIVYVTGTEEHIEVVKKARDLHTWMNNAHMFGQDHFKWECIYWLKKYLPCAQEKLKRTVPPKVKVSDKKMGNLSCYAYGFQPPNITVKWVRNNTVVKQSEGESAMPNPDGSFQIHVTLDAQDRNAVDYACHVEHIGLNETQIVPYLKTASTKPGANLWITGVVFALLSVAAFISWMVYKKLFQARARRIMG